MVKNGPDSNALETFYGTFTSTSCSQNPYYRQSPLSEVTDSIKYSVELLLYRFLWNHSPYAYKNLQTQLNSTVKSHIDLTCGSQDICMKVT